jgi:predicted Zn-dependent peptidase
MTTRHHFDLAARRLGRRYREVTALLLFSTLPALSTSSASGQAFDRNKPPELPPPADLKLPPVQLTKLPNGLTIRVVEMHEVPLVQVTLRVKGGARLDGDLPGLTTFTAGLLDEGAGSRDAFGIAAEAAYLGANLNSAADWDHSYVSLSTPRRTLGAALDLMADVALRPNFKSADIARERDLRLAQIVQQRDQPNGMATLAFGAIVFPTGHPYHRPLNGDSAATARLDSATVRGFYARTFRPDQSELVITGDITLPEARTEITRRFGGWIQNRMMPPRAPTPPAVRPPSRRAVFLVGKPGAAQSVIMIGAPGVARTSPDFPAIEVMNTILGGSFSSRLNQNLRETRGYSYGAGSQFVYRPVPGPFVARSAVRTDVTDSSLVEFFKELNGIRDSAVSPAELTRARSYIALGLPGDFETTGQMGNQIGELLTFGLPPTYFDTYVRRVMAVTAADVQRVARTYFDPAKVDVVVVGDIARIRPGIEALDLGPVTVRDLEGREVTP